MLQELFTGKLVRLAAIDPEEFGEDFSNWGRDSEFKRLLDSDPPRMWSAKAQKEWVEKQVESSGNNAFWFAIHAQEDGRLLGAVDLGLTSWGSRDAFVGISIGDRDFWGKGYGTEAMQLLLCYTFTELNLNRVSLNVFEYNQRAVRSYEKAGFQIEGRQRQAMIREGRRWDILYMGILRIEWMENYGYKFYDG